MADTYRERDRLLLPLLTLRLLRRLSRLWRFLSLDRSRARCLDLDLLRRLSLDPDLDLRDDALGSRLRSLDLLLLRPLRLSLLLLRDPSLLLPVSLLLLGDLSRLPLLPALFLELESPFLSDLSLLLLMLAHVKASKGHPVVIQSGWVVITFHQKMSVVPHSLMSLVLLTCLQPLRPWTGIHPPGTQKTTSGV